MTGKNIIFITVDDGNAFWRYRDVFGARLLTPGLDRIFDASAAFTSAYCQAPMCGPSRASLMSGLAPHQTGVLDNYVNLFDRLRPEQLWQYRLKRAGYYCSTAGKIHHGFKPLPPAIHNVLYSHPARPLSFGPHRDSPFRRYGGITGGVATTDPGHDALYYDAQSAQDAIGFLQTYDRNAPFYREIGFHHPHFPLKTPEAFKLLYDEGAFEQPEAWARGFDVCDYPDLFMIENIDIRDRDYWRKSVRNYFSAYSHVDSHIARVWDALKASKHADNTVLIFAADHGLHLGDKNRFRKFTLWEESCRVPLLIHDPDAAPAEIADPVALLDVGPTILDYAGCPPLRGAPGRSLRDIVQGGARDPERAVPTFLYGNVSMRKGGHRITLYQDGSSEFHHVEDDMWLTKNLAGQAPGYEQMRRDLIALCPRYGLKIHDPDQPSAPGASDFAFALPGADTGADTGVGSPSQGAIAVGPIKTCTPSPRYRVDYSTLNGDGQVALPNGYNALHYGADTGGTTTEFRVSGNAVDNEFLFPGSFNRFRLELHTGPGTNKVRIQNDDHIIYAGPGQNELIAGNSNCVLYGGTGRTQMQAGTGRNVLHGGPGDAVMRGGKGENIFTCGSGSNQIFCGPGLNHITIDGGINQIEADGEVTVVIRRTGLPQMIRGFGKGTIDLSDWAVLGPVALSGDGPDSYLQCQTETVVFQNITADQLRPALTGATVARL